MKRAICNFCAVVCVIMYVWGITANSNAKLIVTALFAIGAAIAAEND